VKRIGVVICLVLAVIGIYYYKSVNVMVEVDEEEIIEGNRIDSLNIETTFANVTITWDKTDQIKVHLDGELEKSLENKYELKVEEAKGQLEVEYLSNENIIGFKIGSEKYIELNVILPEKVYEELHISTTSGTIAVENIHVDKIGLTTTSGVQTLIGSEIMSDAIFQSTSGDIELEQNIVTSFRAKTTSGNVGTQSLEIQHGQIESTSGNLTLKKTSNIEDLHINTTSGDVEVDFETNPDSLQVIFEGSSGIAEIYLPNILYKGKDENSINGVIGEGKNVLSVRTTSGDLIVK